MTCTLSASAKEFVPRKAAWIRVYADVPEWHEPLRFVAAVENFEQLRIVAKQLKLRWCHGWDPLNQVIGVLRSRGRIETVAPSTQYLADRTHESYQTVTNTA